MPTEEAVLNTPPASVSDAIIAAVGDGITVHDRDFRIIYQNQVMQNIFGECVGKTCHEAYNQSSTICNECPVATCFSNGEVHTVERIVNIGDKTFVFENCASPIRDKNGTIVAAVEVVRNATERKEAEEKITKLKNLYDALSRTNKAILHSGHRDFLFREICQIAVEHGKLSLAVIGTIDRETGSITPVASCGRASSYLDSLSVSSDIGREEGRGPTGIAIREGVPYICNDFHGDPTTGLWRAAATEFGINSSAAFPIKFKGESVGVLKVYADKKGFFDPEIIDLFQEMVDNVSFAIKNYHREEKRRLAEIALQESEMRLKLVLEGSNDGYWDWDIETGIVNMSPRFAEMIGRDQDDAALTISELMNLVHADDKPRVRNVVYDRLSTTTSAFDTEFRMTCTANGFNWFRYRGKVVSRDEHGAPLRVSGVASNITEKKRQEEELNYLSTHDTLTGLFNRAYFDTEMVRMANSRQYPLGIVVADVDGLKNVNDNFGHAEGDQLIKRAALALRNSFRGEDVVARIGGDEFAVILQNADESSVKEAIKRVLVFQSEINREQSGHALSISLGSATAESSEQLHSALKQADSRMYYYKIRRKQQTVA
ncbi:MAG: diguanylate cyclase [Deltaproteobacteria bacterium]|nr:diguanylate cyclase [Deltaproteobacteria bacterium]